MAISDLDIANRFTHHPPTSQEQVDKYEFLRKKFAELAREIVRQTPEGREQSLAITKLEEVMFWSLGAIARKG